MFAIRDALLASCCLICVGCNQQPQQSVTPQEWASLQTQISVLASQVQSLNEKIDAIPPPLAQPSDVEPALVSATEPGYGLARTKLGPVAVSVEGVEKYLDGYKVRLKLGNLTSGTFGGVKLRVNWGPLITDPSLNGTFASWQKAQRSHDFEPRRC